MILDFDDFDIKDRLYAIEEKTEKLKSLQRLYSTQNKIPQSNEWSSPQKYLIEDDSDIKNIRDYFNNLSK